MRTGFLCLSWFLWLIHGLCYSNPNEIPLELAACKSQCGKKAFHHHKLRCCPGIEDAVLHRRLQRCIRRCKAAKPDAALHPPMQHCNTDCKTAPPFAALHRAMQYCRIVCRTAIANAALLNHLQRCNWGCSASI